MTINDIIKQALKDLQVVQTGETPSTAELSDGLDAANRLMDYWASKRIQAFNFDFTAYTLVPNLNPHTIGPSGCTYTVTQRPVYIESAAVILTNSNPAVDVPINIRDDDWYAQLAVKALTSTFPTDLYYSPGWPNGSLYFWPVPTAAYGVRLETWTPLSQFSSGTGSFSLPPGYWRAFEKNLVLELASQYGAAAKVTPLLIEQARQSLQAIQANNNLSPRISTAEAGQGTRSEGSMFNWRTGQIV